jgi:hypothetical protein
MATSPTETRFMDAMKTLLTDLEFGAKKDFSKGWWSMVQEDYVSATTCASCTVL